MKPARRCQRIFILSLLFLSVLTPAVLVYTRLRTFSFTGRNEFIEELNSIKHSNDALKLSTTELEVVEGLREPPLLIYKDGDNNSVVKNTYSNQTPGSEESISSGTNGNRGKYQLSSSISKGKRLSNQVTHDQNLHSQSQGPLDVMVMQMKDQIVKAKVFLQFSSPSSTSHFLKELRQRIRDVERALGEATRDSELPTSASLKMKAMEHTLLKAGNMHGDCPTIATKLRAMTYNSEERARAQKNLVSYLVGLAGRTTPKGLHCLSMRLTSEYFSLEATEQKLPDQHKFDQDDHHFVIFSDNVLACAVVVNSTVSNTMEPEKVVFHVVTDALNLPAISIWFLLNPPGEATVQIHDMGKFNWLSSHDDLQLKTQSHQDPRYISPLNHLRFFLPDIFPAVNKIVLLDHDVVVQRDLAGLWDVDMKGKVVGVVDTCQERRHSFPEMDTLMNFSDPMVARKFNVKECAWAFGLNVFDLRLWRRRNLTAVYRKYLHLGLERTSWKPTSLPLGWLTVNNQTLSLDRRWLALGLGHDPSLERGYIEAAAVIHYNGVMKPWLDIRVGRYKGYWSKFLNYDHSFLQECNIHQE